MKDEKRRRAQDRVSYFILHPSSFILFVVFAACAKIADPRPPLLLIPQHTNALTGLQRGTQVVLRWPLPSQNTNGTPVTTLAQVAIYRLVEARAYQPAPLRAEEFARQAQRIRSIPAAEAARGQPGGPMAFTDDLTGMDRSLLFQRSFRYAVVFLNDKNKSDGFSNYFFVSPLPIPESPPLRDPKTTETAIELSWSSPATNLDGSRPPKIVGYNVYRSEQPGPPAGPPLNAAPISDTRYQDRTFEFGKTYYYAVSVVASTESPYAESRPSQPVPVTPKNVYPPKPPSDVVLFPDVGEMRIVWAANSEPDLAGYTVYRSESPTTGYRPLTPALITAAAFKDTDVPAGKKYYYRITATDRSGNESAPSEEVSDIAQ